MPTDDQIIESIRLYRDALKETQALYVESGELVRGSYGWLNGGDSEDAAAVAALRRADVRIGVAAGELPA